MKTLNEQIQRLRDVLVTCYKAIKEKGGTIPEEGERNMTNLPAAVASIPQVHGVLTELEVTANGVYVPEEGADGFSKVTAKFDTSSLPKVKVSQMYIRNGCEDENGIWNGEMIDFSSVTTLNTFAYGASNIKKIVIRNKLIDGFISMGSCFRGTNCTIIDLAGSIFKPTTLNYAFQQATAYSLVEIHCESLDTSECTDLNYTFGANQNLKYLDLTNWNVGNVTNTNYTFYQLFSLETLIGGLTEEQVDMDTITCLNGLKISIDLSSTILDRASIRALINGLADVNDQPAESRPTLTLGSILRSKLKDEDVVITTNKGWNLS